MYCRDLCMNAIDFIVLWYQLMPQPVWNRISFPCLSLHLEVQYFCFFEKEQEMISICIAVVSFFLLVLGMLCCLIFFLKKGMRFYFYYFLHLSINQIRLLSYLCLVSFNNPIYTSLQVDFLFLTIKKQTILLKVSSCELIL